MKLLEKYFGSMYLKCENFIDFIKDGLKMFIFLFSPWVLLGTVLIIQTLIKFLIGG